MGANSDFGEFLVARGLVGSAAWGRVQEVLKDARQSLAGTIAGLGLLSETDLASAFADHYELEPAGDSDWPLDPVDIPEVNPTFLQTFHILPCKDCGFFIW